MGRGKKFCLATGHLRTPPKSCCSGSLTCSERGILPTRGFFYVSPGTDCVLDTSRTTADAPYGGVSPLGRRSWVLFIYPGFSSGGN